MAMPEYVDGVLEIRRIVNDESGDYPEEKLERIGLKGVVSRTFGV